MSQPAPGTPMALPGVLNCSSCYAMAGHHRTFCITMRSRNRQQSKRSDHWKKRHPLPLGAPPPPPQAINNISHSPLNNPLSPLHRTSLPLPHSSPRQWHLPPPEGTLGYGA